MECKNIAIRCVNKDSYSLEVGEKNYLGKTVKTIYVFDDEVFIRFEDRTFQKFPMDTIVMVHGEELKDEYRRA